MTAELFKPKVLVVDDEPQILDSIQSLLEEDFEVLLSTDATSAVEVLKDAQVAVILADQRMPKLTGGEFLAKAREICDATRILITGYVDIDALIRAVNDGQIHSYVPKPWEPASLKVTVLKAATYANEVRRRKKAAEIVAEQQKALAASEAAYRQQTKLLRSVLESMSDGVLAVGEGGKIMLLNRAAEELVPAGASDVPLAEWSRQFGIYRPGTQNIYPADELPLARAMRGEKVDGIELFVRNDTKPDGMHLSVSVRPLKDDGGEIKGGVAIVQDITLARATEQILRQAKEEAERANRAKSEFLSRMSHELRTPLNSILGFAQLLDMAGLSPQHQGGVQQILKGGYHLLELINEVLDLARIEAGRLSLSPEPVQIDDAVKEALELVRPIATRQNIALSSDFSPRRDLYIQADRQRLKQILLNLLSNAIKFNKPNGAVVLSYEQQANRRLRIQVMDTGPGIDPEGLSKIFMPFERLDADRNAVGGTGLGLALSKRMVEAMGGSIGVESTLGVGSRFFIELPITDAPRTWNGEKQNFASTFRHDSSLRGTVLYIEDNSANLRLVEEILANYSGVHLLQAMQGSAGLDLAVAERPDWIVLDLHLPDILGEEVLRQLRENSRTRNIPVTVLSADATPNQIRRLEAAGAREYLTKPLDVKRFLALLESTLQRDAAPTPGIRTSGELAETEQAYSPRDEISLRDLSDELRRDLRSAIEDGEKGRLDGLIAALAQDDARAARALKHLADHYEYDVLTNLLSEKN